MFHQIIYVIILSRIYCGCLVIYEKNDKSNQCINNIFNQNKRLFIIDPYDKVKFNFMEHETLYLKNIYEISNCATLRDFKHFFMLLKTENDLVNIIKQLNSPPATGWKSKYYHYILIETNITKIFEILWDYYIYNVIVIQENKEDMFTYFPFSGGVCNNYNSFFMGNCSTKQLYFPEKIPDNLHECEYKIMSLQRPPFVINIDVVNDNPKKQGFEVTMVYNIGRKLNITLKNIPNKFRDWGSLQPNGTFTDMYGLLQKKCVDLIFGGLHYSYTPSKYFDYSVSHKIVNNAWFVPAPLEIPKWQNLLIVFQAKLWILLLTTFIIKTTYWYLITKKPMDHCILYIWSMFLLISIKPPKKYILKMQFYICTVSFLIITTAYVSKLFGVLTKPIYKRPITSVDEILQSNIKIGFHPAYVNRINDSKYRFLLDDYIKCSAGFECMDRTAFQRDLAVIKFDVQTFFMIPRVYTSPRGRPMLHWFNEVIGHSHLGYV